MKRRVSGHSVYVPPDSWLGAVRDTDPNAEIVYLSKGEWALGAYEPPNRARSKQAREILNREWSKPEALRRPGQIRLAKAVQEGFVLVSRYTTDQFESGLAAREFRVADHLYNMNREEAFGAALDASMLRSEDPARNERLSEEALYRAKDAWAYFGRGRKHFIQ